MIDIYKDDWVVEEPIKDDEMKRLIISLFASAGMRYSRSSVMLEPYASAYPHIARTDENTITAYAHLQTNPLKNYTRVKIKDLLAAVEEAINNKNK